MVAPNTLPKKKRKRIPRVRLTPGAMPGTVGKTEGAAGSELYAIAAKIEGVTEGVVKNLSELDRYDQGWPMLWLNVNGLGHTDLLLEIGKRYGLHSLALEDAVNVHQRPKVEHYDGTLFVVMRMVDEREGVLDTEQVSFFLGRNFLITFQEREGDCFEPVRKRMRTSAPLHRFSNADYVCYALIDAIIDHYFPTMERLGDRIEELEERIIQKADDAVLEEIYQVRRDLLKLRRVVWPMREAVDRLYRDETKLISEDRRVYLRDCYDHCVQLLELVEAYRDISAALMESYRSQVSLDMNEVMKVLTIIATLFIPITFIAGIYGMNFNPDVSPFNMPELNWIWGYPFAWLLMLLTAGAFIYYFRVKGWLGKRKR